MANSKSIRVVSLVTAVMLCGCGGGGGGGSTSSPFIRTFSGPVQVDQGNTHWTDQFDLTITTAPNIHGSLFRRSDGDIFSVTGTSAGSTANITGTDSAQNTMTGTFTAGSRGALSLAITGSNSSGPLSVSGSIPAVSALNIGGNYAATETVTYTISAGGQSQTQTTSGAGQINLLQTGNAISYVVPGTTIGRTGTISGSVLTMTGPFIVATGAGVVVNHNSVTIVVQLLSDGNNEYNFSFVGKGTASGTVQGTPFTVTGTSQGTLTRTFAVAVAVLRGGPIGTFDSGSDLDALRIQAETVDPTQVIAQGFGAGPNQSSNVTNWLNSPFISQGGAANVILVGHSLGGSAVEQIDNTAVYSRITIDPIDLVLAATEHNQRSHTFTPTGSSGAFYNELASNPDPLFQLLGHHVLPVTQEQIISNTDHFSVVPAVASSNLIYDQVNECLNQVSHVASIRRGRASKLVGPAGRFSKIGIVGIASASP